MYFNDNKKDTNIDLEFNKDKKNIFFLLNKYKIYLISITVIILMILITILLFNKKEKITYNYLDLLGDENITLYLGADYIEPGYEAYNSESKNLTDEVEITSNLNVNKTGEYEIIYSIKDVTKSRKISVIEKPEDYTYIYLNTVDNDINIYVKLGEEYKEPGYKVFNSQGQDLNNKVTITGRVDTNKKGNYKLTYSVKDSNAVLVSATRTVIVMDSEIGLSLDNDEYTNKDVEINVKVIDGYFEYMILPDGKRVDKNIYSYTVSENGEYKFTIYNKKGMSKTNSIKVSNIDKVAPTGSCSGSYSGGKSTINISAKDNIEISKYVLNTVSYNQNKIVVNGEIKTANITIYDKAGNSKSISCTLKDENKVVEETPKEEPKEEPKENPLDSIYTSSNSHKNSINGIRYMLYDQADPRWGKKKYTDGKTIAEKGCLLTAIAVISSSANSDITPLYIFNNKISINYYMTNAIPIAAGKDNFSCIVGSITKNNVVKDLSSGKVGIIKVEADSIFTASQHYMSLIDISSDGKQIFIGNSYGGGKGSYNRTGWFDIKTVLTDVHEYVVCTPTQKLINKFK